MNIELWFPTAIGLAVNNTEDNDCLKDHCLQLSKKIPSGGENWINRTVYNTDRTYNIIDDEIFAPINTWVEEQVNLYAKELKFKNSCKLQEGWFSIYNKGASQEYHTHPGSTFSCVYCVSAPPDSSPLVLNSPHEPDMMDPAITESNHITSLMCTYPAIVGQLLIFRSYVNHCVPPNVGKGPRITLAYNLW